MELELDVELKDLSVLDLKVAGGLKPRLGRLPPAAPAIRRDKIRRRAGPQAKELPALLVPSARSCAQD